MQGLIDNLIERGLDPKVCRLFIIDGAKALSKVIRRTFGADTPIQRRWTAAGMMEAAKGFRRLKAYKHLPVLRAALAAHQSKYVTQPVQHDADGA